MIARILRLGWVGGILLTLVALIGVGVVIAVVLARPPSGSGTAVPTGTASSTTVRVSVTATRILPIDPSHLPPANHEFVAIAVELTDTGSTDVAYSVNDFLLRDQAGNTFDPDPGAASLAGVSALPVQGTLQPGRRRTGELVFEIPMSDHAATLLWQPAAGQAGGNATWLLTW